MKRILFILFLYIFVCEQVSAQLLKPSALLNKVVSLGDISEIQTKIIFNHLQTEISKYFELISQRKFDEAQEQAFQELDYEECTEENCIRYMQDALQVEYYFSLQILKEENVYQLTLTMLDLDKRTVKSKICTDCTTIQLNEHLNLIIEEINEEIDFSSLKTEPFTDSNDDVMEFKMLRLMVQ